MEKRGACSMLSRRSVSRRRQYPAALRGRRSAAATDHRCGATDFAPTACANRRTATRLGARCREPDMPGPGARSPTAPREDGAWTLGVCRADRRSSRRTELARNLEEPRGPVLLEHVRIGSRRGRPGAILRSTVRGIRENFRTKPRRWRADRVDETTTLAIPEVQLGDDERDAGIADQRERVIAAAGRDDGVAIA